MWGNGYDDSFWGYGYDDIYAGLFAPYAYDDLTGYLPEYASAPQGTSGAAPPASATPRSEASQLTQMRGQDSHDIAGLPIDQFQQAIKPTEAQQAALDELAKASLKAAQDIKAACPADPALTAPGRLVATQMRLEAMVAAVATVRPPLEKFYGLLSDEQKEQVINLAFPSVKTKRAPPRSLIGPGTAAPLHRARPTGLPPTSTAIPASDRGATRGA